MNAKRKVIEIKFDIKSIYKPIIFENNYIYNLDLSSSMYLGPLKAKELSDIYKDGRVTGLVVEHLLVKIFKNLSRADNEKASYDVLENKWGTSYEVRSLTRSGVKTCPSNMIGKGRIYNKDLHKEKLEKIDYFIFIDIMKSPIFKIIPIKSDLKLLFQNKAYKSMYKDIILI